MRSVSIPAAAFKSPPLVCLDLHVPLHFRFCMKSERRHELQTNSLDQFLKRLPELLKVHGSKVLLVVILVLLVMLLLYNRTRRSREQLEAGWTNIAEARMLIERLKRLPQMGLPAELYAEQQKQLFGLASTSLNAILSADNQQLAAEAYVLRGDLNWAIANLSDMPEATTRPALKIEPPPQEAMERAEADYLKVERTYSNLPEVVTLARFGLAAVAENRLEWDRAEEIYQQIQSATDVLPAYKQLAERQLKSLSQIRKGAFLVPSTQPTTAPAAAEATTQAAD